MSIVTSKGSQEMMVIEARRLLQEQATCLKYK